MIWNSAPKATFAAVALQLFHMRYKSNAAPQIGITAFFLAVHVPLITAQIANTALGLVAILYVQAKHQRVVRLVLVAGFKAVTSEKLRPIK